MLLAVVNPIGDGIVDKALPLEEEGGSAGPPASPPSPPAPPAAKKKKKQVDVERSVNVLFVKTRLCRFHGMGLCSRGQACKFAHTKAERKPLPNFSRTKLCPDLGHCTKTACRFAHAKDDLRSLVQQPPAQPPAHGASARASAEPAATDPQGATAVLGPSIPQQPSASAGVAEVQNAVAGSGPEAPTKPDVTAMRPGGEEQQDREPPSTKFARTKLCKFFLTGCCLKQDSCNFAHGEQDLRQGPEAPQPAEHPGMASDGAGHGSGRGLARTVADVPAGKPDAKPQHSSGPRLQQQPLQVHARPDLQQQQQGLAQLQPRPGQEPAWGPAMQAQPLLGQQPPAWQLPLAVHAVQPLLPAPLLLGHSQPQAIHAPLAPPVQPIVWVGYLRPVVQGSPVEAPNPSCDPSVPKAEWKEQQLDQDQQQQRQQKRQQHQQQQAVCEGQWHSYDSWASDSDTDTFDCSEPLKKACRDADLPSSSTVWSRNTTPGFTDYGFSRSTTPFSDDGFDCFDSPLPSDLPELSDVEEMSDVEETGPRQEDVKAPRGRAAKQVESRRWADMMDDDESQGDLEESVEVAALDAY